MPHMLEFLLIDSVQAQYKAFIDIRHCPGITKLLATHRRTTHYGQK